MKYSIIGAGTWGTTLGQVLTDNGHQVLLYDSKESVVQAIKEGKHPFFDVDITPMATTTNLIEALEYSEYLIISIPTAFIKDVLIKINSILTKKTYFINVSKGIDPESTLRVSQLVNQNIDQKYLGGYCYLAGPSHAEELILRMFTLMTAVSTDEKLAKKVQVSFNNQEYLRVYTNNDVVGAEVGGAVKNAIAIASGIMTGIGLGENARAALITRGVLEIIRVVESMGGKRETVFGLTGLGDLIVTASSEHSRNFKAGKLIGQGRKASDVLSESNQAVEGIRSIIAVYNYAQNNNLELPIIETAYDVVHDNISPTEALHKLLKRNLRQESV
jgi:glycerol-3-phosphate dehydrogenase (NAD(P)+)